MSIRTIPHQTDKYHKQKKLVWCGMYTIKNVVESYKEDVNLKIKKYGLTNRNRFSWLMLPWSVLKMLKRHWLKASIGRYKTRCTDCKINFLKQLLHTWPIVLVIWHAYKWKKDFNIIKAVGMQHYVSLWWYNNHEEVFYIYDSWAPKRLIRDDLPIWNIALKYKDIIRCRRYWWFSKRNTYISIDYNLQDSE